MMSGSMLHTGLLEKPLVEFKHGADISFINSDLKMMEMTAA